MKIHRKKRAGFTLLEVVFTMVLSGMTLVFAAMLLETSTKIFIDSKQAAEDSQKIQIAMNRLGKELIYADAGTVVITDGRTVQWTSRHPDRLGEPGTATWNGSVGSDLQFFTGSTESFTLLDNVSSFSVSSTAPGDVTITVKTRRSDGVAHTITLHPRYNL